MAGMRECCAVELAQKVKAVEQRFRAPEGTGLGEDGEFAAPAGGDGVGQAGFDFADETQTVDSPCFEYGACGFAAGDYQ